jgi:alpha-ketoglutarate-dependent taurine dioxygenase
MKADNLFGHIDLPPPGSLDVPGGLALWKEISVQQFNSWVAALSSSKVVRAREGSRTSDVREMSSPGDNSASTAYFGYHYDGAYLRNQPDFCGLFCISSGRGDSPTGFLRAADLLASVVEKGTPLDILQRIEWSYLDRWHRSVRQPLVQRHPRTGELLLRCSVGAGGLEWTGDAVGHSPSLLQRIWSQISDAARELPPVLHHWQMGDFAWWDNRRFLHARLANERDPRRFLKRVWAKVD